MYKIDNIIFMSKKAINCDVIIYYGNYFLRIIFKR